ncbi:TVP38/TMEM64 family protein [Candidatus Roizmanbacteria bacterium]|jgi:uncharacterized membrane protein YdjX (TVP38/TMEM64 family)|nr:TVP38/TMEM64 family protein [Candidatus Roizmanbacteria bacterium]
MSKKKNDKPSNRFWTLIGMVFLVVAVFYVAKNMRDVRTIVSRAGLAGPVVLIFLYGFFAVTPITTDPLTVVSGVFFGPIGGVFISWIGNNLAAMVEYYFGRHIGKVANFKKIKEKLPFGLSRLPVDSPWVLIFGRLVPGYGGKVISIMGGIYHVPVRRYLWTSALTNFFGSLLLSLGGYQLIHFLKLLK